MIPFLKGRNGIQEHINMVGIPQCCVPELVLSELLVGAYKTGRSVEFEAVKYVRGKFETTPVSFKVLEIYSKVRAHLEEQGNALDTMDLLIAATALAGDFTLVSHNTKHFSRIPDLKLEDWIEE